MPKLKTNRGAAKRFRATGSGLIQRHQSHKNHILTKKSRKRKRALRQGTYVAAVDSAAVRQMCPFL
jgi:large subunit ribosomal protein L35